MSKPKMKIVSKSAKTKTVPNVTKNVTMIGKPDAEIFPIKPETIDDLIAKRQYLLDYAELLQKTIDFLKKK